MSFFGPFANTISGHPNHLLTSNLGASSISPTIGPQVNLPRNFNIANLFGISGNGAVTVSSLQAGSIVADTVNNINLSEAFDEVYSLTVDGTYDQVLAYWDYNSTSTFGKTVKLMKTYHDSKGTRYALIKTTYNWNLNNESFDTSDTSIYESLFRTTISQNLGVKDVYEVVVIGFTFSADSSRIIIPNYVQLPVSSDDVSLESIPYQVYYPVREIWACFIYAGTQSNNTTHLLSINELSDPTNVLNTPAALMAPYIEKISLKRKIDNNVWFFSGICPRMIHMPNLRKIVGVSCISKAPILSGCNATGRNLLEINLPTLREIKNCVFGSGNNSLSTVHLPNITTIKETIFMAYNPAITELYFPMLDIVQGCDFFLAQNVNLEILKLPACVKYQPHLPLTGSASDQNTTISNTQSYINILNTLYTGMGLNPVFSSSRRYNGTNSMGYFLYKDSKLFNFEKSSSAIDYSKGIFTTYPGTEGLGVYLSKKDAGEFSPVETLTQYKNRIARENGIVFSGDITANAGFSMAGSSINSYMIDTQQTGVVLYNSACDTTIANFIVCPVDPRTSLMNTIQSYSTVDITLGKSLVIQVPSMMKFISTEASTITSLTSGFAAGYTNTSVLLNRILLNYYGMMLGRGYVVEDVDSTPATMTDSTILPLIYKLGE